MMRRVATVGLVLIVSLTLLQVLPVGALSVGSVEVKSLRGMPFLAEIPLVMTQREQQQGISATIGDLQEYQEEGLQRPDVVDLLTVTWIKEPRDMLRVTSQDPISDAAFELVLLVHVGQVTVVKTYPVVLFGSSAPAKVAAPSAAPPPKPAEEATIAPAPKAQASPKSSAMPSWQQELPPRYGPVEQGMTLYSIVGQQLGVPREKIWQVIVRIWQANQTQFTGGNLHGLKSGSYLLLPSDLAASAATLTSEEAQGIVAQQWDAWQTLRHTIQGRQSAVPSRYTSVARAKAPAPLALNTAPDAQASPADAVSSGVEPPSLTLATVTLPAELQPAAASPDDLRLVFRGLEEFLTQRLPQLEAQDNVPTTISATELQSALQGLEDRLMQRFQTSIQQVVLTPQPPSTSPTLLEQILSADSMAHVLVLENTVLLLAAAVVLWRWYRRGA